MAYATAVSLLTLSYALIDRLSDRSGDFIGDGKILGSLINVLEFLFGFIYLLILIRHKELSDCSCSKNTIIA